MHTIWDFPYDSPSAISSLLEEHSLAMSKKFGQNFLISEHTLCRITGSLGEISDRDVWEIGPGIGALTKQLLLAGARVTAFEIDHGFCRILRDQAFPGHERFCLVEGDALKTWPTVFERTGAPYAVCGNLPYNVGSVCIARLLEAQCLPEVMVFTLQLEVAQRLAAQPRSKMWSTLSILAQLDYEVEILFTIKSGSFYPPPKVDSAVVRLHRRAKEGVPAGMRALFLTLCDDLFAQRRKTVRNNLLHGKTGERFGKEVSLGMLAEANIAENERAEDLALSSLITLANLFHAFQESIQGPLR